ncbi:MAG: hypothetical protein U1B30_02340 [Pseudomonadota bacterium]|nr:hypothetical protein [Pseudomonadota bacterium]
MEGISDIRIVGIDETRPPKIRKEPYIDIIFKLSHQAPAEWCYAFNTLLAKHASASKIKESEGLYIEAYVRTADEITPLLALLKTKISECSRQYIERIELAARSAGNINSALALEAGEQGRLNRIIAALDYDEVKV